MLYFLQVTLYTMAMLAVYVLLLRDRPLYQVGRYYLIASAVLPLILPLARLPEKYSPQLQNTSAFPIHLPVIVVSGNNTTVVTHHGVAWLPVLYLLVSVMTLLLQLRQGFRLWQLIRNNRPENHAAYNLIITPGFGPGSFGRYIFFPEPEINDTILAHERAHIELRHTLDIILLTALQTLFWPNLLLVWIKKELRQIHEFQADERANVDENEYTQLLVSSVFRTAVLPVMHSFTMHPIKRRLIMIQKVPLKQRTRLAVLLKTIVAALLVFTGIIYLQSCKQQEKKLAQSNDPSVRYGRIDSLSEFVLPKKENASLEVSAVYSVWYDTVISNGRLSINEHRIYNSIHSLDTKPESIIDIQKFLADNLKYPESAKQRGVEGGVVVSIVIDEHGKIGVGEIMRSPDSSLSAEALRVVRMLPDWKPGIKNGKPVAVFFYLPVIFKLE